VSRRQRTGRLIGAPLFVQIIVLMAGTFLGAVILAGVALWNLPPPSPVTYPLTEVMKAYQGQPLSEGHRPLRVRFADRPPGDRIDPQRVRFLKRYFAEHLHVDESDVQVQSSGQRWYRDRTLAQMLQQANQRPFLVAPLQLSVKQPDGRWKIVESPRSLSLDPQQQRILVFLLALALAASLAAYIFARRLASPLISFAEAAERLGRDPRAPPLEVRGSSEIIVAARAFNDMQQRLRRYVEDRTAMVGAIAHDLRTPLTRLRFRIEAAPEDLRAKMSSDLDEMEAMISATLAFVRDATQAGHRTKLELSSLLESLSDELSETGKAVSVEHAEKVIVEGDPISLKRMFANLIENAIKFGGAARVRVHADGPSAVVEIDDDGPGVPVAEMERVFDPFYRREPSRSRETGGIGLGLAVVRTIARAHGGDAELQNRKNGGLTARVRLPL
jgi:two-component system, OmpR family, sensor kinase